MTSMMIWLWKIFARDGSWTQVDWVASSDTDHYANRYDVKVTWVTLLI